MPHIKALIIKLNTEIQLGKEGIDSLNRSLGEYAPFTIVERQKEGLQVKHIDFNFTGKYWKSWKVTVKKAVINIETDPNRFSDLVDDLRFAPEHVGLTLKSLNILRNAVRKEQPKILKKKIRKAFAA